ncbi:MAG: arginine--tRNA ligase [Candidatus Binatia bacterium]|nr:arginine--tRNA ligase [Candidatus Binatia bacterium]MDG1958036.1 arginine--tRNA ligase [Candidatus Binatia bacterium]MDG2011264.1 arginine--tRNA ligase [Candidatus Binatia bacterium]
MKSRIEGLLSEALIRASEAGQLVSREAPAATLESPKDRDHGDLASNIAMILAKPEKKAPRAIAEILIENVEDPAGWVESIEIAGPGFLNFRLKPELFRTLMVDLASDSALGISKFGERRRVQVEFVSANPTGPLTVGHGRNAVLGDSIARVLEATGHDVHREYYFNNAGRQMKVLGDSVRGRYLELVDEPADFPEDGYQGDYIREVAAGLRDAHGRDLVGHEGTAFRDAAEEAIFREIRETQERLGIRFDEFFNEDTLYASGSIDRVLAELEKRGLVDRREGAVWLLGEKVGLPKDRVLVKSSGEPAYRLPDIAYHENKLGRGFDEIVDVLGADHIAENQEVKAGLAGLGLPAERIRAVIYQFVTLTRHGEQVKMSTRRAEYVTLDDLIDEVGTDAVRFFFLSRKSDTHLEFDLELAKKRSTDNPVYYVQYAHARIANLFAQAGEKGVSLPEGNPTLADLAPLVLREEQELITAAAAYAEVVEIAARELEPHRLVFYLQDFAALLHRFYNQHRVLGDAEEPRRRARLFLLRLVQRVVADGLSVLGVSAPDRM